MPQAWQTPPDDAYRRVARRLIFRDRVRSCTEYRRPADVSADTAGGLARMVEEDSYCIDVLTQVSAATKALQAVALGLLEDHLSHCVQEAAVRGGPDADAKLHEAAEAIARLVRS